MNILWCGILPCRVSCLHLWQMNQYIYNQNLSKLVEMGVQNVTALFGVMDNRGLEFVDVIWQLSFFREWLICPDSVMIRVRFTTLILWNLVVSVSAILLKCKVFRALYTETLGTYQSLQMKQAVAQCLLSWHLEFRAKNGWQGSTGRIVIWLLSVIEGSPLYGFVVPKSWKALTCIFCLEKTDAPCKYWGLYSTVKWNCNNRAKIRFQVMIGEVLVFLVQFSV